jgi:class 3 adenylate cyclase/tetratricopeptide (TPR) repeat protein
VSAQIARAFARAALDAGEFLLAGEAARAGLRRFPSDPPLEQLLARSLARLGSVAEARQILARLEHDVTLDAASLAELFSLRGDLSLQEGLDAAFDEARAASLRAALEDYERAAHALPGAAAPLLESATARCLLGGEYRREVARLAQRALAALARDAAARAARSSLLERAKALALLGQVDAAKAFYREAAAREGPLHELGVARREARLLARAQGIAASTYDDAFPPLQLIAFAGHMLDPPGRKPPRFPAHAEERVRRRLEERLAQLGAHVGFSSAAAGADLLFVEALTRRGGAAHVVLPWTREAFVRSSVAPCGRGWVERFEQALAGAASLRILGEAHEPSSAVGFEYANEVMAGLARLTARSLDLDLTPLAVWDELPGGAGGTATFVHFWRRRGVATEIVGVADLTTGERAPAPRTARSHSESAPEAARDEGPEPGFRQQVKAILFADIVGYSRLPESLIPVFVREFKGRISSLVSTSPHAPSGVSTWGDALHLVFDDVSSAGLFTLDLVDEIAETDWSALGLAWDASAASPRDANGPSIRAALHAGPVFEHFEPIVRQLSFTGAHVTLAARIEPIVEPGEIFASEAFAALAALSNVPGVACDFVGTLPLAKNYAHDLRVYRLRRVRALPLDAIARVMHEEYCREAIEERWETPATNPSLRAWEDLPSDLKASNREAAADIPAKLRHIDCELEPCRRRESGSFAFRDAELERLARWEHERWCASLRARGWQLGSGPKDEAQRRHPRLVAWEELPEAERAKDVAAVRRIPRLLAEAGFRIRRRSRSS